MASEPNTTETREKSPKPLTYRVLGIPAAWDKSSLEAFLEARVKHASLKIQSLALAHHDQFQTATVDSFSGISMPHNLSNPLATQTTEDLALQADHDFLGLTTLFRPPPEDHQVDVVAVCGLGGHAYGSYRNKDDCHMWLRDALPDSVTSEQSKRPMARILTYGYKSPVNNSKSMQGLEDLATAFRQSLCALESHKPLVFIGHSLGGLIIKQAIIAMHKSEKKEHQRVLRTIYGIAFFGVPHLGMDVTELIAMSELGPNLGLLTSLRHLNSPVLDRQKRKFHQALGAKGDREVISFYETLASPTAKKLEDGTWSISGPEKILVTKPSATHGRDWETGEEHICELSATHSDLVKIGLYGPQKRIVLNALRDLCRRSLDVRDRVHDPSVKFLVPYTLNHGFVGRERILEEIKAKLELDRKPSDRRCRRLALYGLGGIGKTQIALAFAHFSKDQYKDFSVFWVHASHLERFRDGYKNIAEKYSIPGHDDPKLDILILVRDFLTERIQNPWIMILDNMDDKELFCPQNTDGTGRGESLAPALNKYLPDCLHGSILMTTRDRKLGSEFTYGHAPIKVEELSDDEAFLLVQNKLGPTPPGKVSRLSERLGHLPLALVQALAFVSQNDLSIDEYIQLLDNSDESLVALLSEPFHTIGRGDETPNALAQAWILSFDQISKRDPLAADFISFISMFDRQAIPSRFIVEYQQLLGDVKESNKDILALLRAKSMGTLKAYSFVTETKDGTYDMHRLVQLVTREWILKEQKLGVFRDHAVSVLFRAIPSFEYHTMHEMTQLLPHIKAILAHKRAEEKETRQTKIHRAQVMHWTGHYFYLGSQYVNAELYLLQAYRLLDTVVGNEHIMTLDAGNSLSANYEKQARWAEASTFCEELLRKSSSSQGHYSRITLCLSRRLGMLYWQQHRLKEAEQLLLGVVKSLRSRWGDENPDTLAAMSDLANIYMDQQRLEENEKLLLEVTAISQKVLGKEDPYTIASLHNLATTYNKQNRLEEAEDIFEWVAETRRKLFGAEDPQTLEAMGSVVWNHNQRGKFSQAEEIGHRVLHSTQNRLGKNDPETLRSMHEYAITLEGLGRLQEATDLMHDCFGRMKAILGLAHPLTLNAKRSLLAWGEEVEDSGGESDGQNRLSAALPSLEQPLRSSSTSARNAAVGEPASGNPFSWFQDPVKYSLAALKKLQLPD